MTTQEMFDFVVSHLKKQGKKAYQSGLCKYRTPGGLSCAVGCLIKNKFYYPDLEGLGLCTDPVKEAVELSVGRNLTWKELELLMYCQDVHDLYDPDIWREYLFDLAGRLNLKFNWDNA